MSNEDFENSYEAHVPEEKLSIGFLTFPFKVRFQDEFSFDTEFNFNTAISWNIHRVYQSKLNLQAGIGMGNVRLNQNNASGIGVGKEQNVATLNLFGGLMLEHKKAQIGIYLGVDHINNQSEYTWTHNGTLWYGLGVGFNAFKLSSGKKDHQ